MDTPDNSSPKPSSSFLSKFEDSPVFNYISTLSPIKQFSLNHSAPSFRLLSFTSPVQLESLQTPPPITCPQEPNVQSANHDRGALMNNSAQDASEGRNADPSKVVQPCESRVEKSDKPNTRREVYVTTNEPSKLANVIRRVKHECVSPESNVACSRVAKLDFEFCGVKTTESISSKAVQENQDNPKEAELLPKLEISTDVEDNKEVCEWEKFIHETCDIFGSQSPTQETHNEDQCDENDDSETFSFIGEFLQTPSENIDGSQKLDPSCPRESIENHEGATRRDETTQTSQVSSLRAHIVLAEEAVNYAKTDVDEKPATQQQQTASRRCLDYEVSGSHYRKLLSEATGSSPTSNLAASTTTSNEQRIASSKRGSNKFSSALPGIGLHLNALASTGREKIIVKRESLTCRRQLISVPGTASSFDPLKPDVESLKPPSGTETVGRVSDMQKDETCLNENTSENSAFGEDIGLPPGSPQKKRKKPDTVGESDSCKRCNCKRSKCLKLYCDCFAAGLYCVEPCNCQGCFNKPAHEDMVLETRRQIESRNPLAFAPKVVICSSTPINVNEVNKTPASARHKRGCNCKKSGCLKKYCECFQGGVGCSPSCRCEGCKNTFGRKKGFEGILFEEAKILHKSALSVTLHDEALKTDHENQEIPEPPNKERQPSEFTLRPCGKSLESSTSQKIDNSNVTNIAEKDEPADDYLIPTTTVKSTSPNCKRISSHHHDFEPSPAWKSSRKLILRAVPSFSTVPKQQESSELQEFRQ